MRQMQHTDSLHNDANVRIATCAIAHWAKEREWQSKCLMSDDGILCAVSSWQVSIGPNKGSLVAIDFTWHTHHTHTIHAFHVARAQHAVFSNNIYTNSSSAYSNLNADMEYVVFSRLAKRFTTAATPCVHIPIRKLQPNSISTTENEMWGKANGTIQMDWKRERGEMYYHNNKKCVYRAVSVCVYTIRVCERVSSECFCVLRRHL